ncbi:MAG: HepT-like ribonuclease domain-containing protein [Candidatus Bathyarchaeia archaeon]
MDILEACRRMSNFIEGLSYEGFLDGVKTQDEILRNIEIMGEAVKNLSDGIEDKGAGIEWGKSRPWGMKLIHFYFGVNLGIVWDVVKNKIPALRENVSKLLSELEDEEKGRA